MFLLSLQCQFTKCFLRKFSTSSLNNISLDSLRITGIQAFQIDLPLHEGSYQWANSKSVQVFDCTVVKVMTNSEIVGYGEQTPLGPNYLPMFALGTRAGIKELGSHLLGENPLNLNRINQIMDFHLKGNPGSKSAIDMACWDILGKATKLPVCELLGGRFENSVKLYRAISQRSAEEMTKNVETYIDQGYRIFQLKVGGDPMEDIRRIRAVRQILDTKTKDLNEVGLYMPLFCDANTGWRKDQALTVINAVKDLDIYIEQPCLTYEECKSIRRHCNLPMILDESVDDINMLVKAISEEACDAINLKISKVGGLTKAKTIRDLCVNAGIPMNIEDTWGGDIVTAAIAALAQSTNPKFLLCSTDFNSYGPKVIASTTAKRINGHLSAPKEYGLGVTPIESELGSPVIDIRL